MTLTEDLPFQQFSGEGRTYFNEHENKANPSGKVAGSLLSDHEKDVIEIHDELIVVLLHEKESRKIRVASLQADGTPYRVSCSMTSGYPTKELPSTLPRFIDTIRSTSAFPSTSSSTAMNPFLPESPTLDPIYYQLLNHLDAAKYQRSQFEASGTHIRFGRQRPAGAWRLP